MHMHCLVALFLNATHEVSQSANLVPSEAWIKTARYFPRIHEATPGSHFFSRLDTANECKKTCSAISTTCLIAFMHECQFSEISKQAKLEMKSKNTLVEPWPLRLEENANRQRL